MKKILFVCYGLGIGGIEKCMVNLINVLPEDKFDIDILLMNPEYDLEKEIQRKIRMLDRFNYIMNTTDTKSDILAHGGFLKNFEITIRYLLFRLSVKISGKAWKWFGHLPQKYDVAIAYSHHDYSRFYVIDKVVADKKIVWYHNGKYNNVGKEYRRDQKYFSYYDSIVAVSSDCSYELKKVFPEESDKIIVLRNICNEEAIIKKSRLFIPNSFNPEKIHIVTVGRLTKEKGADLALDACKLLVKNGNDICWHWVGDGNQKERINELISEKGLEEYFVLEGNQDNPYPFIKNCDIYVQPSYYEAYSTTITEAKVLKKPIITTDVGGMRDQIEDGVNGFIVPIDADSIAEKVKQLINNPEKKQSFSDRLSENNVDNQRALKEYYETVF